jgi:uncharacterized damage-inducible protein DinB
MRVSDLERLYDYNYWANRQLIGAGWLDRCGGPERGARLNPEDYPTVESLVRTWTRVGGLMQHSAVHAVHHRGQVALLLRTLRYAPGNFDLLVYVGAKRNVPA